MKNYLPKIFVLFSFLAIIYSCTREHSNFLDPNFSGSPDAPDSLSIRTNLDGNVLILWKDSGNDDGFEIWRKLTENTLGNFVVIAETDPEATFFIDGTVTLFDTSYTYKVVTILPNGTIAESEGIEFTPSFEPSNLQFFQVTNTQVELKWRDNSNFEDGFLIQFREQGGANFETVGIAESNDTTFVADNLSANRNYSFSVQSILNKGENQLLSNRLQKTFDNVLEAPSNVTLKQTKDSEVLLIWQDNTQIEVGYGIYRGLDSLNFTLVNVVPPINITNIGSYKDTTLYKGIEYFYTIAALGLNVQSFSDTASVTPIFPGIQNFDLSISTQQEISLNWDEWDSNLFWDISGIRVLRQVNDGEFENYAELPSDASSLSYTDLNQSNSYAFKLAAFTEKNISDSTDFKKIAFTQVVYRTVDSLQTGNIGAKIRLDSNESRIATSYNNALTIEIRDLQNLSVIQSSLVGHIGGITDLNFNSDGTKLISASGDSTVKLWDLNSSSLLWSKKQNHILLGANFSNNEDKVVSFGIDSSFVVRDATNGDSLWFGKHNNIVVSGEFYQNDSKFLSVSIDSNFALIKFWNSNGNFIDEIKIGHLAGEIQISPDETEFIYGTTDGKVELWDLNLKSKDWEGIHSSSQAVNKVKFSKNGNLVASTNFRAGIQDSSFIKVWNAQTGDFIWEGSHKATINDFEFISNDNLIVTCSEDSTLKVWQASDGKLFWSGKEEGRIKELVGKLDGSNIYTINTDGFIRFWGEDIPKWFILE
ncbi:MAG: hypothetical protein DWQ06_09970 [Calditrichaeota bacterium]|nr:MAG: hypothetical protein DWQ06_09970 [Calditrichota bacterium]